MGVATIFKNSNKEALFYTSKQYKYAERAGKRYGRDYQKWKIAVLKRDKYKCCECGCKNNLNVHHINQYIDNIFLRTEVKNGITLCKECHSKKHPWMCKPRQKTIIRKKRDGVGEEPELTPTVKGSYGNLSPG